MIMILEFCGRIAAHRLRLENRSCRPASERAALLLMMSLVAWNPIACGPAVDSSEGEGFGRCDELRLDVEAVPPHASFVLIVNDTMRRDRIGVYGGTAHTSSFDSFARANLLFKRAVSESDWTRPAIATLFTSLYPSQHGVMDDPSFHSSKNTAILSVDVLGADFLTLAEALRRAGFRTAAFVSNPWMETAFGFGQGFEIYDDSFASWDSSGGEKISRAGLDFLDGLEPDEPFFLYLHYINSHLPYGTLEREQVLAAKEQIESDPRELPNPDKLALSKIELKDGTRILETGVKAKPALFGLLYDRGLEEFDQLLGLFLDGLRERPSWNRTGIIVTSDHGEALYERGYGNHGRALFQEEVAIPMAARLPGVTSRDPEVACPVGLIDVMPTLCQYLDIECGSGLFGQSFIADANAASQIPGTRYLLSEGVPRAPKHRAIQNQRYKLIFEPSGRLQPDMSRIKASQPYSLYDLEEDPGEVRDLLTGWQSARFDGVLEVMIEALESAIPETAPPKTEAVPIDPELRERLRHLGYLENEREEPSR